MLDCVSVCDCHQIGWDIDDYMASVWRVESALGANCLRMLQRRRLRVIAGSKWRREVSMRLVILAPTLTHGRRHVLPMPVRPDSRLRDSVDINCPNLFDDIGIEYLRSKSCHLKQLLLIRNPHKHKHNSYLMESSLHQVWESAVGNPFVPTIGKDSQFFVGFTLLSLGLLLSGFFGMSMLSSSASYPAVITSIADRSILNIPLVGIPASLSIAYV